MRNPLKRLAPSGAPKLTMRERAAMLKASAARVIRRRPAVQPTDQPSGETLLANTVLDRGNDGFRGVKHLSHELREGAAEGTTCDGAGKNGASRSETDMGRHETFNTALPLAESLLSGTSIGKTLPAPREAILAHRAARQALHDVCDATDELAIQQAGGDTSDEAMAPARAEWERRNDAELDAWNELLNARPLDHAELIAQIRYIAASPALGDFQHPEVVLENIAQSVEALADPFEGRPTPAGFVPYPFDAPSAWLNIRGALKEEGERLLRIALGELDRRMDAYRASRFDEDEVRSHETRLRRELRIDALMALSGRMDPGDKPLPEPGSEAAMAAFHAACGEATRLMDSPLNGYPELRHPKAGWWTKHCLNRALDDGTITPVEFARLHPLAAEREHRNEAALLATNLGALHALAHAGDYPLAEIEDAGGRPTGADESPIDTGADAELLAIGCRLDAAMAEYLAFRPAFVRAQEGMQAAQQSVVPHLKGLREPDLIAKLAALEAPFSADVTKGTELSAACDAIAEEALRFRPTTLAGLSVLARAARSWWVDAFDQDRSELDFSDAIAVSLIEGVLFLSEGLGATSPAAEPDPIHAAIAASRAAEVEIEAFAERIGGRRLTRVDFDEEDRLCDVQRQTRDAALSTPPTTHAGRLALVKYVRFVMGLFGMGEDGEGADNLHMWKQTHATLMAALEGPVGVPSEAPPPILSGATISQLDTLHETVRAVWLHVTAETQAAWCWDEKGENHNVIGRFLWGEADRWARFLDVIAAEATQRKPVGESERDSRLELRLRQEMLGNGRIHDAALLAEINAAWGA